MQYTPKNITKSWKKKFKEHYARTATDMDGTLYTDLWKSETSREIKKSF